MYHTFAGPIRRYRKYPLYDPLICEVPHDLWLLPAHADRMGSFRIADVRSFPLQRDTRVFLDVRMYVTGERYTLILPSILGTTLTLSQWEIEHRPWCLFRVSNRVSDTGAWTLERVPSTDDLSSE